MASSAHGNTPDDFEAICILSQTLNLTQRQAEVLHWIAEGKSNAEIACILSCSVNTIKTHLKEIFERLGLHSRTAAAAAAASAYRAHIHHARKNGFLPGRAIPSSPPSR